MRVIGIDPGASGGICLLADDGATVTVESCVKMPATAVDLADCFRTMALSMPRIALIERVNAMPSRSRTAGGAVKVVRMPATSAFSFGRSVGLLEGALAALGIRYDFVLPTRWQSALQIASRSKGESKTHHKRRLREAAQRMFPDVQVTAWNADALLIGLLAIRERR